MQWDRAGSLSGEPDTLSQTASDLIVFIFVFFLHISTFVEILDMMESTKSRAQCPGGLKNRIGVKVYVQTLSF